MSSWIPVELRAWSHFPNVPGQISPPESHGSVVRVKNYYCVVIIPASMQQVPKYCQHYYQEGKIMSANSSPSFADTCALIQEHVTGMRSQGHTNPLPPGLSIIKPFITVGIKAMIII